MAKGEAKMKIAQKFLAGLALVALIFSANIGLGISQAQANSNQFFNFRPDFYPGEDGLKYGQPLPKYSHGGNERDWLRWGSKGQDGNTINVCRNGQIVDLWAYIHNSQAARLNGDQFQGSVVAHGTTLRLHFDSGQFAQSHKISASIDADEINPITDSVTLTCDTEPVALEYVGVVKIIKGIPHRNTNEKDAPFGAYTVWGSPRHGALLGFKDGVFPACRDYTLQVTMQLMVVTQPDEPENPPVGGDTNQNTNTVNGGDSTSNADAEVGDIDVHGGDIDVDVDGGDSNSHANNDNYNEVNNNNLNNNDNSNVNNVNVHVTVNTDSGNSPGGGKPGPVVGKGNPQAKPKHLPDTGVNLTFAFLAVVVAATIAHRHFKLRLARR